MDGAVPQTTRPSEKRARETSSGTTGPRRSLHVPAATMPTTPLASGAAKLRA